MCDDDRIERMGGLDHLEIMATGNIGDALEQMRDLFARMTCAPALRLRINDQKGISEHERILSARFDWAVHSTGVAAEAAGIQSIVRDSSFKIAFSSIGN